MLATLMSLARHRAVRARSCVDSRVSRVVVRVVSRADHTLLRTVSRVVHECHACCSHALSHAVHTRYHVPFACVARLAARCSRVSRVSSHVVCMRRVCHLHVSFASPRVRVSSRVDHVCRATYARDNNLFSLVKTHVNNIDSSDRIF
jgi:hypothetical protein